MDGWWLGAEVSKMKAISAHQAGAGAWAEIGKIYFRNRQLPGLCKTMYWVNEAKSFFFRYIFGQSLVIPLYVYSNFYNSIYVVFQVVYLSS